jgi:hypothetical protein
LDKTQGSLKRFRSSKVGAQTSMQLEQNSRQRITSEWVVNAGEDVLS